jgi:hypothetical protein
VTDKIVELGHRLDTRESTATDDERQQGTPDLRIGFDVGLFENMASPRYLKGSACSCKPGGPDNFVTFPSAITRWS